MVGSVVVAAILALVGLACAHPDSDTLDAAVDVNVNKRDLEFNQYVPGYRLRGEPSCEELREMWRLSKREARRATSTNQLPRNQPVYGRLIASFPDNHRSSKYVYGSPRYGPSGKKPSGPPQKGSFDILKAILPSGDRRGKYEALYRMVASARGPNRSSKGKYDELRRKEARERMQPQPVALSLRAAKDPFQPSPKPRREPPAISPRIMRGSTQFSQQAFTGPLLPADSRLTSFKPWQPPAPNPNMVSTYTCTLGHKNSQAGT